MQVVPVSVGIASRAWDEQRLDLDAAAGQIAGAGTGGFTSNVSGAASRFTTAWERFTTTVGTACESQADGLRSAMADYVATDQVTFAELVALNAYLAEER